MLSLAKLVETSEFIEKDIVVFFALCRLSFIRCCSRKMKSSFFNGSHQSVYTKSGLKQFLYSIKEMSERQH